MIQLRILTAIILFSPMLLKAQVEVGDKAKQEARFIEASTQLILENYEEAKTIFQSLYKADKSNAAICFQLSRSLNGLEQKREALTFAQKTIELENTNSYYFEYLIDLLLEEGLLQEASVYAEQLFKLQAENDYYFNNWLSILNALEDYPSILNALEQKINSQGLSYDLLLKQAGILIKLDKAKKAEESLSLAEQKFPKEPEVGIQYIAFLFSQGKDSKAKEKVDQFLLRFPEKKKDLMDIPSVKNYLLPSGGESTNPVLLIVEAQNLSLDQKIKTLIPFLSKLANGAEPELTNHFLKALPSLTEQYPDEAKVYAICGDVYFFVEQYEQAVTFYEACLNKKKNILAVWDKLLYAQYNLGKSKTMLTQAEDALDYFPNQAIIWRYYCLALLSNHKYDDALYELDSYSFLIQSDKEQQFYAALIRCQALYELGQYGEAKKALDKAQALKSNDTLVKIMNIRLISTDKTSAKDALKSIEEEGLRKHPMYTLALADVLIANEQYTLAATRLNEALKVQNSNLSLLLERLADVYILQENKVEAANYLQKALDNNGYKSRIQSKLNKLN